MSQSKIIPATIVANSASSGQKSSGRSGAAKVQLAIQAGAGVEIFIINNRLERVAKGVDSLQTQLPPGFYKLKFKAGSLVHEQFVELEPDGKALNIAAPEMKFASPAPLSKTCTTREHHRAPAHRISLYHSPQQSGGYSKIGSGSEILVFARQLRRAAAGHLMSGLSLHDLSGALLVDFAHESDHGSEPDGSDAWAGSNVELAPGCYCLRLTKPTVSHRDDDILEQIIVASPGWQTQLFMVPDGSWRGTVSGQPSATNSEQSLSLDLSNTAVFMKKTHQGFDPDSLELRQTELARQGLINGRNLVSGAVLEQMLYAKYENPMLGIYGAQLLMLSPKPDRKLLKTVADNLFHLIGAHPDVVALEAWLAGKSYKPVPQETPPMLRSSWHILVNASIEHPDIIPPNSLAAKISNRLWGDSLWLMWHGTTDVSPSFTATTSNKSGDSINLQDCLRDFSETVRRMGSLKAAHKVMQKVAQKNELSETEKLVFDYVAQVTHPRNPISMPALSEVVSTTVLPQVGAKATSTPAKMRSGKAIASKTAVVKSVRLRNSSSKAKTATASQSPTANPLETLLTDGALVRCLGIPQSAIAVATSGLIAKMKN